LFGNNGPFPRDAPQFPGKGFFHAHEGRGIRADGRRIGVAFGDAREARRAKKGEGRRQARESRPFAEGEKGS
jgi:hypothetical protein